jgi:hypothetical protein
MQSDDFKLKELDLKMMDKITLTFPSHIITNVQATLGYSE